MVQYHATPFTEDDLYGDLYHDRLYQKPARFSSDSSSASSSSSSNSSNRRQRQKQQGQRQQRRSLLEAEYTPPEWLLNGGFFSDEPYFAPVPPHPNGHDPFVLSPWYLDDGYYPAVSRRRSVVEELHSPEWYNDDSLSHAYFHHPHPPPPPSFYHHRDVFDNILENESQDDEFYEEPAFIFHDHIRPERRRSIHTATTPFPSMPEPDAPIPTLSRRHSFYEQPSATFMSPMMQSQLPPQQQQPPPMPAMPQQMMPSPNTPWMQPPPQQQTPFLPNTPIMQPMSFHNTMPTPMASMPALPSTMPSAMSSAMPSMGMGLGMGMGMGMGTGMGMGMQPPLGLMNDPSFLQPPGIMRPPFPTPPMMMPTFPPQGPMFGPPPPPMMPPGPMGMGLPMPSMMPPPGGGMMGPMPPPPPPPPPAPAPAPAPAQQQQQQPAAQTQPQQEQQPQHQQDTAQSREGKKEVGAVAAAVAAAAAAIAGEKKIEKKIEEKEEESTSKAAAEPSNSSGSSGSSGSSNNHTKHESGETTERSVEKATTPKDSPKSESGEVAKKEKEAEVAEAVAGVAAAAAVAPPVIRRSRSLISTLLGGGNNKKKSPAAKPRRQSLHDKTHWDPTALVPLDEAVPKPPPPGPPQRSMARPMFPVGHPLNHYLPTEPAPQDPPDPKQVAKSRKETQRLRQKAVRLGSRPFIWCYRPLMSWPDPNGTVVWAAFDVANQRRLERFIPAVLWNEPIREPGHASVFLNSQPELPGSTIVMPLMRIGYHYKSALLAKDDQPTLLEVALLPSDPMRLMVRNQDTHTFHLAANPVASLSDRIWRALF